jgi:hypothetical protein|nr:hypothetical protein [Kofleriaceae bacterium]
MTDDAISNDLAVLATAHRRSLPPIAALRALAPAPAATGPAHPAVALLGAAGAYASRVGELASHAAVLAGALSVVALPWLYSVNLEDDDVPAWSQISVLQLAISIVVVALAARGLAAAIAARRFARAVATADDPIAAARGLAGRFDTASLALAIASRSAFAIVLGKLLFAIGFDARWAEWFGRWLWMGPIVEQTVVDAVVAAGAATVVGLGLGVAIARGRLRIRPFAWGAAGAALGVATVVVGTRWDVGTFTDTFVSGADPSHALRIAVTAGGALAVVLVATALAVAMRRRPPPAS